MGRLLDSLKTYFENTPKDVLRKDLDDLEYLNEMGPDVLEYADYVKEYFGQSFLLEDYNVPVYGDGQNSTEISPDSKYFLAA